MANFTTLDGIDKFLYDWLTIFTDKYGFGKHKGWVKANQNAPAPQLPYGTWYLREMKKVGHRDQQQISFDHITGKMVVDDYTYFNFTVEITSYGYGSNQLVQMLSQAFDTDGFYVLAGLADIGYVSHQPSQDISAVADAEVREARQFTVTFNCTMRLRDGIDVIETVEVYNDLDDSTTVINAKKTIYIVNNGTGVVNNGNVIINTP